MQQGDVAQLVERVLSMHEVWGSIPHLSILLLLSPKFITVLSHLKLVSGPSQVIIFNHKNCKNGFD